MTHFPYFFICEYTIVVGSPIKEGENVVDDNGSGEVAVILCPAITSSIMNFWARRHVDRSDFDILASAFTTNWLSWNSGSYYHNFEPNLVVL